MNPTKILTYLQLIVFALLIIVLLNDVYKIATGDCDCHKKLPPEEKI